jgi:hypothetical protein
MDLERELLQPPPPRRHRRPGQRFRVNRGPHKGVCNVSRHFGHRLVKLGELQIVLYLSHLTKDIIFCILQVFLAVLNTDYYKVHGVSVEPRLILSSLAANNLLSGVFVLAFGIYPNLFQCWPLGEDMCRVQVIIA